MRDPTNPAAPRTDLLHSLPKRTPAEVRTTLQQIVAATGGWTQDDGERYWHLNWCRTPTITGWPTPEDAEWAAQFIRGESAPGPACRQWHAVLDTHTLTYVGPSLFQTFCHALPSTLHVLAPSPWVVRIPTDRFRHVLVPGLPTDAQPWLVFRAKPDDWFVGWGVGDYPQDKRLRTLIDASGLPALIRWLFYEVRSQPQWARQPTMKLWSDEIWECCPRDIAIKLVPALHTLLTDLDIEIGRELRLENTSVGHTPLTDLDIEIDREPRGEAVSVLQTA